MIIVSENIGMKNTLIVSSNMEEIPLTLGKERGNRDEEQLWTAPIKAKDGEISLFIKGREI